MRALAKFSNNPDIPSGTVWEIDQLYEKFLSQTFGRFFLLTLNGEQHKCRERRCDLLYGGEWELVDDEELKVIRG